MSRTRGSNGHLYSGSLIIGGDFKDTMNIDIEANLDQGNTSPYWRDPINFEHAEHVVLRGHLVITLEYLNLDARLIIIGCSKALCALCGQRSAALN